MIKQVEKDLAEVRMYKGKVAIYQGDNWHDNPELYQTELKEKYLMAKLHNLKQEFFQLEIIKERTSEMISEKDIMDTNLISDDIPDEEKEKLRKLHDRIIKTDFDKKIVLDCQNEDLISDLLSYRIAYYTLLKEREYNPDDCLLITYDDKELKKYNEKLSKFLPETISQKTLTELFEECVGEKVSICKENQRISMIKESNVFKEKLDAFIKKYIDGELVNEDLKVLDETLFTKQEIKEALFNNSKDNPNYDWACLYFINKYKSYYDLLSKKLVEKRIDEVKGLPFDDPKRIDGFKIIDEIRSNFKKNGVKIIKDYFKKLNRKKINIYSLFIESYEESDQESINMKEETIKALKKHKLSSSDVFAVLYINNRLTSNIIDLEHVFYYNIPINGNLPLEVSNRIFKNSGLSFFGKIDTSFINLEGIELFKLNDENVINNSTSKKMTLKKIINE